MTGTRFRLYESGELDDVIAAMAGRIEALPGDLPLVLVGVLRRGAPLADRLAKRLAARRPGREPLRIDLKVKRYGDDLTLLHPGTELVPTPEQAAADFSGQRLIVVDDVLYQGYSAFRVLEFLRGRGAESVHLAVLVDRCCTRLPVHAEITGLRLQIAPDDVIECNVPPYEPEFAVDLLRLG
jgi:pyrimidine operon attenuation protein / uracil phosphoribosyltransferase